MLQGAVSRKRPQVHGYCTAVLHAQIMVPWILAQWEEYHTGVMLYSVSGLWGVLEANYATAAIHILTALWGPAFWNTRIPGFSFGE